MLSSVYASLAYLWLYQTPPSSYENALRTLNEYDAKGGQPHADVEINRACAFGQMYSYLKDSAESQDNAAALVKAREGALAAIQKALSLDSTAALRLKELLWASADPQDNDLSAFQDDIAFTTLLPRS